MLGLVTYYNSFNEETPLFLLISKNIVLFLVISLAHKIKKEKFFAPLGAIARTTFCQ